MENKNKKLFTKTMFKKCNEHFFKNEKYSILKPYFPLTEHIISLYGEDIFEFSKKFRYVEEDLEFTDMIDDLITIVNKRDRQLVSDIGINIQKDLEDCSDAVLIHFKFSEPSEVVKEVSDILEKLSPESYLVGGCIRDILTMNKPKDYDFVTDTEMIVLKEVFEKNGFDVTLAGESFLVVHVSKNDETFEIANFRSDKDNSGGLIGNIFEDVERRDFTVGAIYFNLGTHEILDPNGQGLEDIRNRTLRFIGNARERIFEDPLRVFRFYRFLRRGYEAHPDSLRKVRQWFNYSIENTKPERIRMEMEKN